MSVPGSQRRGLALQDSVADRMEPTGGFHRTPSASQFSPKGQPAHEVVFAEYADLAGRNPDSTNARQSGPGVAYTPGRSRVAESRLGDQFEDPQIFFQFKSP